MIGRIAVCLLGVAYAAALHAQAPKRLPSIFGEMGVNWIVEVDGTVKAWGARTPDASYFGDGTDDGKERKTPAVKSLWYSPENRDDPKASHHRKMHHTRYHGLNLHSYWYRNTIEFRYYPSVLEHPEELMQWIIFTQFLVEWGAGRRPELDYVANPNKWLNTLYKIYLGAGMMDHIRFPGGPEGKKVNA